MADYTGLKKFLKNYKGDFFDRTAAARKFGYKDKDVVYRAVKEVGREDLLELPFRKGAGKALKYLKEQPKGSSIQVHQLSKKLNVDDGTIIRAIKQLPEKKFIKSKFKTSVLTNEEFTKLYKDKKMSDSEFANYLNNNTEKTTSTGTKFNDKTVHATRKRLNLKSQHPNPVIRGASDLFISNEAKRLNVDTKGLTKEELRKKVLSSRGDEQVKLKSASDPEFLERQREFRKRTMENIKADPKRLAAYKKYKSEYGSKRIWGLVPVEKTSKGYFWRDLVENALRLQKNQLPNSHIQFLNSKEKKPTSIPAAKNVKLIDINILDKTGKPKILTYDNFLKHADDNVKLYGMNSKDILAEYEKKRFIQTDPELRDALNKKTSSRYDPTSASSRAVFSPVHIHHTAGRGKNAFNIQLGVGIENMDENSLHRKFNKDFDVAKTLTDKKIALKKYIESVPKNLEVRPNLKPYGTRESFEEMLTRVGDAETTFDRASLPRDKITFTDEQLKGIRAFASKPGGRNLLQKAFTKGGVPAILAIIGGAVLFPSMGEAATKEKPETVQYNPEIGSFVNPVTEDKTNQNALLGWATENPLTTLAGTSVALSINEVPRNYKMRRGVGDMGPLPGGKGKIRSSIGLGGALKPVLTTLGTPLMALGFEGLLGKQRLEEGENMSDILMDPLGPALGVSFMEPLSKASGVVRNAPNRGMLGMFKNYTDLSNVGKAKPGMLSKALRLGMSPRMIAGASRFLGLPGLALTTGLAGYNAYKNYQNEEGMIYNLFNNDE